MTAALGFDSWLAMRHGAYSSPPSSAGAIFDGSQAAASQGDNSNNTFNKTIEGDDLGCYYCNDVVAPRDVSMFNVYRS